jgi:hypothetical protein
MLDKQKIEWLWNNPYKLGHILGYTDLTETHNKWIKEYWLSEVDKTLMAHRNSFKTTSILVIGVIWYLFFYPNTTIAIIRKSETGAKSILIEIIKHYQSEKLQYIYQEWFNTTFQLKDFSQSKLNLPTRELVTKEDNINCFGKGGNITGFHYNKVLIDDIVTEKDRYSKAERESTKNYVRELQNIKTVDGQIIATLTPWHPDDASTLLPKAEKYPLGTLQIPGFTEEKIKELKATMTASLYSANYLLEHSKDEQWLLQYTDWNDKEHCYAWVDPAYSGKNTTSLCLLQMIGDKIICKGWVWRQHIAELYPQIINLAKEYNCLEMIIENNKDEGLSQREIAKSFPLIKGIHSTDNKIYRISFYIKQYLNRLYFDNNCQTDFIEQISYYEEGKEPDDAPDSLASLLREVVYKDASKAVSVAEEITVKEYIY